MCFAVMRQIYFFLFLVLTKKTPCAEKNTWFDIGYTCNSLEPMVDIFYPFKLNKTYVTVWNNTNTSVTIIERIPLEQSQCEFKSKL